MSLRFSALSLLVLAALLVAATFSLTRKYFPVVKVQTQERTVEVTKVVTKIKQVKSKDGTETTETEITDTGTREASKSTSQVPKPKYTAGLQIQTAFAGTRPDYQLDGSMRLVGPFHVTGSVSTSKLLGVGLRMEF